MSSISKKSFSDPDEIRAPEKAEVHVCDMGGVAAAKMILQPGWSWSTCYQARGLAVTVVRLAMWALFCRVPCLRVTQMARKKHLLLVMST